MVKLTNTQPAATPDAVTVTTPVASASGGKGGGVADVVFKVVVIVAIVVIGYVLYMVLMDFKRSKDEMRGYLQEVSANRGPEHTPDEEQEQEEARADTDGFRIVEEEDDDTQSTDAHVVVADENILPTDEDGQVSNWQFESTDDATSSTSRHSSSTSTAARLANMARMISDKDAAVDGANDADSESVKGGESDKENREPEMPTMIPRPRSKYRFRNSAAK